MASRSPLILLPPSEGKAPGGDGPPWQPGSMAFDLDDRRVAVIAGLRRAMRSAEPARRALLGVKGEALAAATAADREVTTAPTRPAIERYTGVLYDALDVPTLPVAARRRLDGSVVILSGLWGLVAPSDRIPDYKLKMGAALPGTGKLSSFWRDALTARLVEAAGRRRIWNLLPQEHDAAWRPPVGTEQLSVTFLEPGRNGSLVAVAHWNKFLKGALVRHLLTHPGTDARSLADWEHPAGYRLDPERTVHDGARTTLFLVKAPGV